MSRVNVEVPLSAEEQRTWEQQADAIWDTISEPFRASGLSVTDIATSVALLSIRAAIKAGGPDAGTEVLATIMNAIQPDDEGIEGEVH